MTQEIKSSAGGVMSRFVLVVFTLMLASGCASITRGTSEAYAIESDPVGATAKLSTGLMCQTPCSVKVKRRGDFTVVLEKEGYEPVTATVTSSVDGAGAAGMAGNVLLGGIIGAGVDAGTGAMHSHKPNPLVVKMLKIGESGATPEDSTASPLDISVGGESANGNTGQTAIDPLALGNN